MKYKHYENKSALERITLSDEQVARLAAEVSISKAEAKRLAESMCEIAAHFKLMASEPSTELTRADRHQTIDELISGLTTVIGVIDHMPKREEEWLDQCLYLAHQPDAQPDNPLPEFPLDLLYMRCRQHLYNPTAFLLLAEWMLNAANSYKTQLKPSGKGQGKRVTDYAPAIRSLATAFEALPSQPKAAAIKEGPFYKAVIFFLQEVFDANIQYPARHIDRAFKR